MDYAMVMPQPGGPERFERRALGELRPGPGEALVRNRAIGLNFLDIYHRTGLYPWPVERDLVVGSEAAGIVEAVAPGRGRAQARRPGRLRPRARRLRKPAGHRGGPAGEAARIRSPTSWRPR